MTEMSGKEFFFSFFFYYSYVHTRLGSFLPPAPTPSLTTHSTPSLSSPQYPAETILSGKEFKSLFFKMFKHLKEDSNNSISEVRKSKPEQCQQHG
jgi:hypothetical protein